MIQNPLPVYASADTAPLPPHFFIQLLCEFEMVLRKYHELVFYIWRVLYAT